MSVPPAPGKTTRKRGPLFWVLIGVASFLLLVVVAFGTIAYLGFQTLQKTTGLSSETIKNHPDFAAVKGIVLSDSSNEILEENVEKAEVRYRNRKTGQEFVGKIDTSHRVIRIPLTPAPETK